MTHPLALRTTATRDSWSYREVTGATRRSLEESSEKSLMGRRPATRNWGNSWTLDSTSKIVGPLGLNHNPILSSTTPIQGRNSMHLKHHEILMIVQLDKETWKNYWFLQVSWFFDMKFVMFFVRIFVICVLNRAPGLPVCVDHDRALAYTPLWSDPNLESCSSRKKLNQIKVRHLFSKALQ